MKTQARIKGTVLVVAVVVLTIATILTVAMFSLVRVDTASTSYMNQKAQADIIATSATQTSLGDLVNLLVAHPEMATVWDKTTTADGAGPFEGTYGLYYTLNSDGTKNFKVKPFISGGKEVTLAEKAKAFEDVQENNIFDLNATSDSNETYGWIGSPKNNTDPLPINTAWIEVKDEAGKVIGRYAYWIEDESFKLDINHTAESFSIPGDRNSKRLVPLTYLASTDLLPGGSALVPADLIEFQEDLDEQRFKLPGRNFPDFRLLKTDVVPLTYPGDLSERLKFSLTRYASSSEITTKGYPRLKLNEIVTSTMDPLEVQNQVERIYQAIKVNAPQFGQRFYRKANNASLPSNVNPILQDWNNDTYVTATDVNIYLKKVAANIRDYIDTDSQPTVIKTDSTIDVGSRPRLPIQSTIFNASSGDGNLTNNPNPFIAIGKEALPYLNEYLFHLDQIEPDGSSATQPAGKQHKFRMNYYFELWNPSTKDIKSQDLGAGARIAIKGQPSWNAGGPLSVNGDSNSFYFNLSDIPGLIFRAGSITVLTTAPSLTPSAGLAGNTHYLSILNGPAATKYVYYVPVAALRPLEPISSLPDSDQYWEGNCNFLVSGRWTTITSFRTNNTTNYQNGWDYATQIFAGNNLGYLDSVPGMGFAPNILNDTVAFRGDKRRDSTHHWRGSAPIGNKQIMGVGATINQNVSGTGDPRANSEPVNFFYMWDQTTFPKQSHMMESQWEITNTYNNDANAAPNSSMGRPNAVQVDFTLWMDRVRANTINGMTAPMAKLTAWAAYPQIANSALNLHRDNKMQQIGELGNIYDPIRLKINAIADSNRMYLKGGGATFKIGQPDPVYGPEGSAAVGFLKSNREKSRDWAAWRLADIFTVNEDDPATLDYQEGLETLGTFNINSVRRDDGFALKALLGKFKYNKVFNTQADLDADPIRMDVSDELVADQQIQAGAIDSLVKDMKAYLDYNGAFMERGEMSELRIFANAPATGQVALVQNVSNFDLLDRAREEIYRRYSNVFTTRGNTYSIYVVAQSVQKTKAGETVVGSTVRRKTTVRLTPEYTNPLGQNYDTFNPNDTNEVGERFKAPIGYKVRTLTIQN